MYEKKLHVAYGGSLILLVDKQADCSHLSAVK